MFAHDDYYGLMPIFEDWIAQFMHPNQEVENCVHDELIYQVETTIAAYNFEDENSSRDDLAADIILCLKDVELDTYPELIFTDDILEVYLAHKEDCEYALADFGGVQECDSIDDAISRGVHAYLADEANMLLGRVLYELEDLKSVLCE